MPGDSFLYCIDIDWFRCLTAFGEINGPRETTIYVEDCMGQTSVRLLLTVTLTEPMFTSEVLTRCFSLESCLGSTLDPNSEEADSAADERSEQSS